MKKKSNVFSLLVEITRAFLNVSYFGTFAKSFFHRTVFSTYKNPLCFNIKVFHDLHFKMTKYTFLHNDAAVKKNHAGLFILKQECKMSQNMIGYIFSGASWCVKTAFFFEDEENCMDLLCVYFIAFLKAARMGNLSQLWGVNSVLLEQAVSCVPNKWGSAGVGNLKGPLLRRFTARHIPNMITRSRHVHSKVTRSQAVQSIKG